MQETCGFAKSEYGWDFLALLAYPHPADGILVIEAIAARVIEQHMLRILARVGIAMAHPIFHFDWLDFVQEMLAPMRQNPLL